MSFLKDIAAYLAQWLASPEVLRSIASDLRRYKPIWVLQGNAFVTRYAEVTEVLSNSRDFGVTGVYAAKMEQTTGAFFLGMEDTERYCKEAGFARKAVRDGDWSSVRELVRGHSAALVERVRAAGRLDVVAEFSELVPLHLVACYFGVPGPAAHTLARWMRSIFEEIFLNFSDDAKVSERAAQSSHELRLYLEPLIAARRRELEGEPALAPGDFLSRLVLQAMHEPSVDADAIRRIIGGIIVGAVATQSKAMILALEYFLRHPGAGGGARRAALADDDAALRAYIWEALRFNPHNPVLVRVAQCDTWLAPGTEHETRIAAGTRVYAGVLSAMFDDSVLVRPEEFRVDRPPAHYLHFGFGQHRCFGERFNEVVLPEALKALLRLPNLRIGEQGYGRVHYEGPFPNHFVLEFDAH